MLNIGTGYKSNVCEEIYLRTYVHIDETAFAANTVPTQNSIQ